MLSTTTSTVAVDKPAPTSQQTLLVDSQPTPVGWMQHTIVSHTFAVCSSSDDDVDTASTPTDKRFVANSNALSVGVVRERTIALNERLAVLADLRTRVFTIAAREDRLSLLLQRLMFFENGFSRVETIGSLMNRAAVKLAEMDRAVGGDLFSDCKVRMLDLCCAPGGFIDYALYRRYWTLEYTGVTLPVERGGLAMRSSGTTAAAAAAAAATTTTTETTDLAHRRAFGNDASALFRCNVCEVAARLTTTTATATAATIVAVVADEVDRCVAHLRSRHRRKTHLVFADGANVTAERQTASVNTELLEAQWLVAKHCLRRGGGFLVKTFAWYDVAPTSTRTAATDVKADVGYDSEDNDDTDETMRLLRDITVHFRDFVVLKPWHSRITNDERYVFFRGFQATARVYDLLRDEGTFVRAERAIVDAQLSVYSRIYVALTHTEAEAVTNESLGYCLRVTDSAMRTYARETLNLSVPLSTPTRRRIIT